MQEPQTDWRSVRYWRPRASFVRHHAQFTDSRGRLYMRAKELHNEYWVLAPPTLKPFPGQRIYVEDRGRVQPNIVRSIPKGLDGHRERAVCLVELSYPVTVLDDQ